MKSNDILLRPFSQRVKTFASPTRYVQGPESIEELGKHVASLGGGKGLLIGGKSAIIAVSNGVKKSCQKAGIEILVEEFGKGPYGPECCWPEIDRLKDIALNNRCDVIIAAGGGKAIDTGKAVANLAGALNVVLPTVAATDAPTSALSAIYDENTHEFKENYYLRKNPDLVLVDTEVIVKAPARMQCAGIGDGFAKKYEGEAVVRAGKMNFLSGAGAGGSTLMALTLCRLANKIYREYGYAAMVANLEGLLIPAFEWVIEANILMSGLGFECCGLAAAHGVFVGLTVLERKVDPFPQYHGEFVHFGTLTQMILEDRPVKEIIDVMEWSHLVGLPTCFEDIGLRDITDEDLMAVAEKATKSGLTENMYFSVTPKTLVSAMKHVSVLGRMVKNPRLKLTSPRPYPWKT